MVINEGVLLWPKLAAAFSTSEDEVMARWIKFIDPRLKNNVKIGGALKWSGNEDFILCAADRSKILHIDLMFFLPNRTVYSIEARWRRICKNSELIDHLTVINNRTNLRREVLKEIAVKRSLKRRDEATKVYEREKEAQERQRVEQEKFYITKRIEKTRKGDRILDRG
jgi:hypothetical protein